MEKKIKDILNQLPNLEKGKRIILAIDGLSRSGKTTLVKELGQYWDKTNIPYHIFHIDDHIEERNKRYHTGHEEWFEYYSLQWDVKGLREAFFEKLRSQAELTLSFYQADTDTQMEQTVQLPEEGIIVIEGVFLQRKEWQDFYDFVVYIDCPRDTRFLRESKETQQNLTKFENRYWKAEDYYLKTEEPLEKADLVL